MQLQWWGHSNPTYCLKKFEFFALSGSKDAKAKAKLLPHGRQVVGEENVGILPLKSRKTCYMCTVNKTDTGMYDGAFCIPPFPFAFEFECESLNCHLAVHK